MPNMVFINLPVADLAAAIRFYTAIGCELNPQFSDDRSASMVWSDAIAFQLLTHEAFAGFSPKPIADAHTACGMLLAFSCESRAHVDQVATAAAAAGGVADVRPVSDMGWMYNRMLSDPDGHILEVAYMDMAALG